MRFGKPCLHCLLCAFGLVVKVARPSVWVSTPWKSMSGTEGTKKRVSGLRKNIFIQISDENPDPSQFAANAANVSTSVPSLGLEAFNASSEVNESGRLSETSFEASIGAVQGSNTILVVPDNATSGDLEDSLA